MPSSQESRNDNFYDWDLGESGWNAQMDANILKLSTLIGLSAISFVLANPPANPTAGDCYIMPAAPTGAWSTFSEHSIAVWRQSDSAWENYNPLNGRSRLLCYSESEDRIRVWNGANWNSTTEVLTSVVPA